jgi:gluconolactonase
MGTGGVSTGGSGALGGTAGKGGSGGTTAGTGFGGSGGSTGGAPSGGTGGSGTSGSGGVSAGGAASGGMSASGGVSASGGAGASGAGMAGTGQAGGAGNGGSAGSATTGWQCPSGVTGVPTLTGTPTRIASVPPSDSFNMNNGNFGNVEGPVWIGDALYVSEMSYMSYDSSNSNVKMSRILKVTSDGNASIFIADSGSNGLATDASGNIVAAVHKDGSIKRFALPDGTASTVVAMYNGARFDSPNDLTIHSNGTIYFSDPNFQAPNTLPQPKTLAYRVPPGGQAVPIPDATNPDVLGNPNGMTLSLAEDYLYISADTGKRYPVMSDGSLGAGETFQAVSGGDGMVIDCAGNIYVAKVNTATVVVYKPDGTSIGTITVPEVQAATNVAFGGADHKTLYITGLGNKKGLFQLTLALPGRPY